MKRIEIVPMENANCSGSSMNLPSDLHKACLEERRVSHSKSLRVKTKIQQIATVAKAARRMEVEEKTGQPSNGKKLKFFKPRPWYQELPMLLGLLGLISPFNTFLVDLMLFHPDTSDPDKRMDRSTVQAIEKQFGATWNSETFESKNGKKLHGWHLNLPNARRTILVSHGNAGNIAGRTLLLVSLLAARCSVFIYDYQGYGKSEGAPSPEGIVEDGVSAYDYLTKEKKVPQAEIVLYGESLGCAVSSNIMKARSVSGVILQSCFSNIQAAAKERLAWMHLFPDWSFPQKALDNVAAFKSDHPPLLLLHGAKDWILSSRYSEAVYKNAKGRKKLVILPECNHNDVFINDLDLAMSSLNSFLDDLDSKDTQADSDMSESESLPAPNPALSLAEI